MVTDEQLIDRLRASMEAATGELFPRSGLLDGIAPRERQWWRPSLGGVAAGIATAAALGVAVLALVLFAHGPASTSHPLGPQGQAEATTLAGLRSQLAVLRRPQRAADRIPAWGVVAEQRPSCSNCLNVARLMPRQSRLLATVASRGGGSPGVPREHIYLVLGTVHGGGRMRG